MSTLKQVAEDFEKEQKALNEKYKKRLEEVAKKDMEDFKELDPMQLAKELMEIKSQGGNPAKYVTEKMDERDKAFRAFALKKAEEGGFSREEAEAGFEELLKRRKPMRDSLLSLLNMVLGLPNASKDKSEPNSYSGRYEAKNEVKGDRVKAEAGKWYDMEGGVLMFIEELTPNEAGDKTKGYGFFPDGFSKYEAQLKPYGDSPKEASIEQVTNAYYLTAKEEEFYPESKIIWSDWNEEDKKEPCILGGSTPFFKLNEGEPGSTHRRNVLTAGGVVISINGEWAEKVGCN